MKRETIGENFEWNFLYIVIVVGIAGIYVAYLWNYGLQVFPDTLTYNAAAIALNSGERVDLTHYPPLLPAMVSISYWYTHLSLESFLLVNSACLIFSSVVSYLLLKKVFRSRSLSAFLTASLLTHPTTFHIFRSGLSEPLYVLCILLTLFFLLNNTLLASGVAGALAILTRYSGVFLFLFFPALVFLPYGKKFTLRDVAKLFLPPLAAISVWLTRNFFISGNLTGRTLVAASPDMSQLMRELSETVLTKWLLVPPNSLPMIVGLIVLLLPLSSFIQRKNDTLALCYFSSLGLVIAARLTIDAEIPLNDRMLYIPMMLGYYSFVGGFLYVISRALPLSLVFSLSAFLLTGYAIKYPPKDPHHTPFESIYWQSSETTKHFLRKNTSQQALYSNGYDFLSFYTGKKFSPLPARFNAGTREELPHSLRKFKALLKISPEVKIVFLNAIRWRWYLWSEKDLVKELDLKLEHEFSDGKVYVLR